MAPAIKIAPSFFGGGEARPAHFLNIHAPIKSLLFPAASFCIFVSLFVDAMHLGEEGGENGFIAGAI